jgi:hypothetical protein
VTDTISVRPRRLLLVCRLASAVLVAVFGVLAALLPARQAGSEAAFGLADQIAFFCIGLLLAWAVLQFTRVRVDADVRGIRVRNYVGEKVLPWQVVAAVRMDDGASWASLDLHDDDTVALLAVQSNDGAHAVDAVVALRRLLAESREQS